MNRLAFIRKDLLERNLSVPCGDDYYSSENPLFYRWINGDNFEVWLSGEWKPAFSIDWDFVNVIHHHKD